MGRRHLAGLLRAQCSVLAFEPSDTQRAAAQKIVEEFPPGNFQWVDKAEGDFSVAIFAETACWRYSNLQRFFEKASAKRILIEKPVSQSPQEAERYLEICRTQLADSICVNFTRRTWPLFQSMKLLCERSAFFTMTVNAGSVGLGCVGIHFLDLFQFLSGDLPKYVIGSVAIDPTPLPSARGAEFWDRGGVAEIHNPRGRLVLSLSSQSSAGVAITVVGENFIAIVDEMNWTYQIHRRDTASKKPIYLYGQDYHLGQVTPLPKPIFEDITRGWTLGERELCPLGQALVSHRMLFDLLIKGGLSAPFQFT